MSLTDLSSVLWRTRELLELLLFKLEEEQLLLAAGRSRWLAHATREVEVARAAYAQSVAIELGLHPEASLGDIANAAPEPWSELLHQHRKAFVALTSEISGLAATNRDLLTAGQRAARETMMVIAGNVETYGRKGQTVSEGARRAQLVDEAI